MRKPFNELVWMSQLAIITAVALTATAMAQEPATPGVWAGDPGWKAARERLADTLASESVEQVEIEATTFDEAMNLIYRVTDTYLAGAESRFSDPATAAEYGVRIVEGLDKHTVTPTVKTLVGGEHLVVASEDDAQALGQLLFETATIIRRIDEGGTVHLSVRDTAARIFNGFLYDSEIGIPLVHQYLAQAQELAGKPLGDLVRYGK